MRKIKKVGVWAGFLMAAGLVFAGVLRAQEPPRRAPDSGAPFRDGIFSEELNLTPPQREALRVILEEHERQIRAVQEATRARVEGILTPEQREKQQRLQQQVRQRARERLETRPEAAAEKRHQVFDRMAEHLNLTGAQKDRVQSLLEDQARRIRKIIADQELSREEKQARMREVRETLQAQLDRILTPEQRTRQEEMRRRIRREREAEHEGRERPAPARRR